MKYSKEKLTNNKGITLVALIVTIIVLLILAAVSLSAVFNQDGIFNRAEQATDKYGQAKARETLELALSDAQIKKYASGLTDEELDNKIAEIEGELLPKEKPNKNLQNVIVDGYIFEIDRSVPKIVDYIGPANGVIITAMITGNDEWVKLGETVSLSGVIKTYSGGTITNSTATVTKGSTTITGFPTTGGNYTISNISEDTDIKITASDSNGEKAEKTINIVIKRDSTAPTVEKVTANSARLKIKFSATGHDRDASGQEGSGIQHFNYTISSIQDTLLEGIPTDKRTGTFKQGQTVEIETTPTGDREETTYTIKVTATDNCDNTTLDSNAITADITTIDGITVAEAKQITSDTIRNYIGKRVIDYIPEAGGKWRVFYYDVEDDGEGNGYFGPTGTLYLKRDYDEELKMVLPSDYLASTEGINMMKRMNHKWAESENSKEIDLENERMVSWLTEPSLWSNYMISGVSNFAIGGASIDMFVKSYNLWKSGNSNGTDLICEIRNYKGYGMGINNDSSTISSWGIGIDLKEYKNAKCTLASPCAYSVITNNIYNINFVIRSSEGGIYASSGRDKCYLTPITAIYNN